MRTGPRPPHSIGSSLGTLRHAVCSMLCDGARVRVFGAVHSHAEHLITYQSAVPSICSVTADYVMTGTSCQILSRPAGPSQRGSVKNASVTHRRDSPRAGGAVGPFRSPVPSVVLSSVTERRAADSCSGPVTGNGSWERRQQTRLSWFISSELSGSRRVLGDPR